MHDRLISEFDEYLKRLFPICRSITGDGNRRTLQIINEIIAVNVCEVPTGTKAYDWTVPKEWNISDAWIEDASGERHISFKDNNLHVLNYSIPIDQIMCFDDLLPHLFVDENMPDAIPYRTSYYNETWGFCLTQKQMSKLTNAPDPFRVVIKSTLEPGSLTFGEIILPGESKEEILISCYLCHPSMANDSLSGVVLTAFLARYLASLPNRRYSYRIVFVPETIGAIVYCSKNESFIEKIDIGLVVTTTGGPGSIGYKMSWNREHPINQMVEKVLKNRKLDYTVNPFNTHGSDERQYSSPRFRINCITIFKDCYYEYQQYHTSLDNLDFVNGTQIYKTYQCYVDLVNALENRIIYQRTETACEPMLSRHNLYPTIGGKQNPKHAPAPNLDALVDILFLTDGKTSVSEISSVLNIPEDSLLESFELLSAKNLVSKI